MQAILSIPIVIILLGESFCVNQQSAASTCLIRNDVKCGERDCSCSEYLTIDPRTWTSALHQLIYGNQICRCDVLCSKAKEVKCIHGQCLDDKKGCQCHPCWRGTQCDQYVNKHAPVFLLKHEEIKLDNSNAIGKVVTTLKVKDEDSVICKGGEKCPCAKSRFEVISGNKKNVFRIEASTGNVILAKKMTDKKAKLVIVVKNIITTKDDPKIHPDKFTLEVLNMAKLKQSTTSHKVARRDVSGATHSLLLSIKPALTTKYYFDIGDMIYFSAILSQNASATFVASQTIKMSLTSTYLTLAFVDKIDPANKHTAVSNIQDGIRISLNGLGSTDHYTANVSGVVKSTIGPLSNLYIKGDVEIDISGSMGYLTNIKSSPVVYAVFPTVNLTRDVGTDMNVYDNATFSMKMQFPKLNFFLLAELTTNIEDFVFMRLKNAVVKNKGSAVTYNGTGTAVYHTSPGGYLHDRVVIDFGYLQCNSQSDNGLDIEFQLEVRDHAQLVNYSKHWMGVGLQAGYRVLWVEQQALVITKNEPTLGMELSSPNTTTLTRFYIDDIITINYHINHTNTSYNDAHNLGIRCSLINLEPYANLARIGSGEYEISDVSGSLSFGASKVGSFQAKVVNTITPLLEVNAQCNLSYSNIAYIFKRPVPATLTPTPLTGTPSIILSLRDVQNNDVRVGEKRTFLLTILLTKMISPLRVELVTPTADNQSVATITKVNKAVIGSRITGYNTSAVPVYRPGTVYQEDHSTVIYDLGTASNLLGDQNLPENKIEIGFDVYFSDQPGVQNATKYWIGAGVVGKPRMIWVGQVSLTPLFSSVSNAMLQLRPSVVTLGATGFQYTTVVKHLFESERWAFDVKVKYFFPPYITFKAITEKLSEITHSLQDGFVEFKSPSPFLFHESLNFTFEVTIDKTKAPHEGRVNVLVPVYLTYRDRNYKESTVVKATHTFFDVPVTPPPSPKSLETPVNEYYQRGFFIQLLTAAPVPYFIYVCIDQRFPVTMPACFLSEDKGSTWKEVDNRVASIVSVDDKGNLYGVARNKAAYLKFDNLVGDWVAVKAIKTSANGFVHSADAVSNVSPGEDRTVAGDAWGSSKDGLHFKAAGGSWQLKAKWL